MQKTQVQGQVEIEVKYTFKKVRSQSPELKGKIEMRPGEQAYTFELEVPVKSFVSSDPEFDRHLQEVTEVELYPLAQASGDFSRDLLNKDQGALQALIDFHGVKRSYEIVVKNKGSKASFILDLDSHGIKRPSLLGIKIRNEVLLSFNLNWS